jgi:hypothetical protein
MEQRRSLNPLMNEGFAYYLRIAGKCPKNDGNGPNFDWLIKEEEKFKMMSWMSYGDVFIVKIY